MGAREAARLAWRAAVARADRALCDAIAAFNRTPPEDEDAVESAKYRFYDAWEAFDLAIAAPKPWARARAGADLGKWRIMPTCDGWPCCECSARMMARLRRKRRAAQRRGRC